MSKLFKKKNKLTNNIDKRVTGRLVYHRPSSAVFIVVEVDCLRTDEAFKIQLISQPKDITLCAYNSKLLIFNYDKNLWVYNGKEEEQEEKYHNGNLLLNVIAKDLYLL